MSFVYAIFYTKQLFYFLKVFPWFILAYLFYQINIIAREFIYNF